METKIKITTPDDMRYKDVDSVIERFEKKLQEEEKGLKRYHVIITGEYPRDVLDEVQHIYLDAGWSGVECKTSSENGERGGLTGLLLLK